MVLSVPRNSQPCRHLLLSVPASSPRTLWSDPCLYFSRMVLWENCFFHWFWQNQSLNNKGSFSQITHMYSSNLLLSAVLPNYLCFSKHLFSKTFSVTLCGLPVSPVRIWKLFSGAFCILRKFLFLQSPWASLFSAIIPFKSLFVLLFPCITLFPFPFDSYFA